ncbi:hypothetical protein CRP01_06015 [Flavilitoribacter nigricans DSM 23189 = NBRC 102662]|uniref:DUF4382 domain-containing protein n=2 Tax=Flavilitoribacter TaxID=2762562 RepID=A0A2D0NGT9_FLAN2|nr:hypothetical protein CRP01_06015 [Flavilitoribacter nigricans DSM 23189 = NBRC 102662]
MLFTFASCEKDDTTGPDGARGTMSIEITDAPIDDASVQGVFVTVADVKIDGQSVEGFTSKTIDIKAYQEGNVALLAETDLTAKTYSSISLVLDHTTDASGSAPGCYVLKTDGTKEALMAGAQNTTELTLNGQNIIVEDNQTAEVVIDFDLRKAIKREGQDAYDFVAGSDLAASLRVVTKASAGTITGKVSQWDNYADKVVVYAYKKGTLDANAETQGSGDGQLKFTNAVTSVQAKADGSFELHFLEEGDYELYFAGYEDDDQDGQFELKGSLSIDINLLAGLDLSLIDVEANSSTTVNVTIIGILPL